MLFGLSSLGFADDKYKEKEKVKSDDGTYKEETKVKGKNGKYKETTKVKDKDTGENYTETTESQKQARQD